VFWHAIDMSFLRYEIFDEPFRELLVVMRHSQNNRGSKASSFTSYERFCENVSDGYIFGFGEDVRISVSAVKLGISPPSATPAIFNSGAYVGCISAAFRYS
jgi:hypothetical protein